MISFLVFKTSTESSSLTFYWQIQFHQSNSLYNSICVQGHRNREDNFHSIILHTGWEQICKEVAAEKIKKCNKKTKMSGWSLMLEIHNLYYTRHSNFGNTQPKTNKKNLQNKRLFRIQLKLVTPHCWSFKWLKYDRTFKSQDVKGFIDIQFHIRGTILERIEPFTKKWVLMCKSHMSLIM